MIMADPASKPSIGAPPYRNSDTAPFVYFDLVAANGVINGAIQIEVAARTLTPTPDGGVHVEFVATAHIRCSPIAAHLLRNSIDASLKMLEEEQQNASKAPAAAGALN
jgi:hypothetical protein